MNSDNQVPVTNPDSELDNAESSSEEHTEATNQDNQTTEENAASEKHNEAAGAEANDGDQVAEEPAAEEVRTDDASEAQSNDSPTGEDDDDLEMRGGFDSFAGGVKRLHHDDEEDDDDDEAEEQKEASFEELLEQYDQFRDHRPGDLVSGSVVSVGDQDVLIDIGARVEGAVPTSEFLGADGKPTVGYNDKVKVMVLRYSPGAQYIPLSYERARVSSVWDDIEEIAKEEKHILGSVVEKVKGGFIVDVGVRAFLPTSLATLKPQKDYQELLGQKMEFDIVKIQRRRGNIILSRKDILAKDYDEKRKDLWDRLDEGVELDGAVKNITDYGVFIDLGGLDGLLHVTDMSWGRITHPKDMVELGEEIKVKVLRVDRDKEKVSLGLKQCTPDPWLSVGENYPPGKKVTGKVLNLTSFGAFVELEPGVEGLIHVSEMSWTKKIRNPNQVLKQGDEVEVVVLDLDPEERRVSLSLRQTNENPWDSLAERFPVGSRVNGKVRNITEFGAFVEIEDGIDGLVHVSDFKWGERVANPRDFVKKNQEVEVVVLAVNTESRKVSLGIKQLSRDPWLEFTNNYQEGSQVTAPISRVTDFGVFLRLTDHVEGLIRQNELQGDRKQKPSEGHKEGDELTAVVTRINNRERKVDLSVRRIHEEQERQAILEYTRGNDTVGATMGDVMGHLLSRGEDASAEEAPEVEETAPTEVAESHDDTTPSEADMSENEGDAGETK